MNGDEIEAPTVAQATFLRVALDALAQRALRWMVLGMSFALFGYAMWAPDWRRLVGACAFMLVFGVPAFWRKGG